jgi:hypothetical protein
MSRTATGKAVVSALLVALLAAPALAEDAAAAASDDYRDKVYIACSLVFIAITVYLVMTHKKGAKLGDDIAHLERRIDELEK